MNDSGAIVKTPQNRGSMGDLIFQFSSHIFFFALSFQSDSTCFRIISFLSFSLLCHGLQIHIAGVLS
ncbi:hypothetical protein F5887DRAFT_1029667 [Amanita rubescens]|nr:hypothetical protein F5887DRAFT_1029667 [Amanita rubescens]